MKITGIRLSAEDPIYSGKATHIYIYLLTLVKRQINKITKYY